MKEETKKRKEKLKKKFSDLYTTSRIDENGKKLSKTEQNKLILKKISEKKEKSRIGDIEYNNDSRVKSKYNYRVEVNEHYFSKEMNKEIVQTIETDV